MAVYTEYVFYQDDLGKFLQISSQTIKPSLLICILFALIQRIRKVLGLHERLYNAYSKSKWLPYCFIPSQERR